MDDSIELAGTLLAAGSEEALIRALEDRLTVGQATGILMGRHNVDPEHAMQMLANDAAGRGITVREAALAVVNGCCDAFRPLDPHGWAMSRR